MKKDKVSKKFISVTCLLCVLTILFSKTNGQPRQNDFFSEEWNKILPLISKKKDVNILFGKAVAENFNVSHFETKYSKTTIWFGEMRDDDDEICNWGITSDTVFKIVAYLKEPLPLSRLKLDFRKFKRIKSTPEKIGYLDIESGVSFTTMIREGGDEVVLSLRRIPAASTERQKCKRISLSKVKT